MPVLINLALNTIFASSLVFLLRRSDALRQYFTSWIFLSLAAFQVILVVPLATFLFRFYPQWSMLYLFDPQIFKELPRWTGLLSAGIVLLTLSVALVAFTITRIALLSEHNFIALSPIVAALGLITYVVVVFSNQLLVVADFDAFWAGDGTPLWLSPAGWAGFSVIGLGLLFLALLRVKFGDRDPEIVG